MTYKRIPAWAAAALSACLLLGGCASASPKQGGTQKALTTENTEQKETAASAYEQMEAVNVHEPQAANDNYRNYYEIFPYSYADSDGDGIGDLQGIIDRLDYIEELGINGIWLTPICPSTTYHKYDVINYCGIDSQFGTMEDFERLMEECNARGIDVILDLVVNHSSSQHEWFRQAAEYIGSLGADETPDPAVCPYVDYYNFTREYAGGFTQLEGTDWYYESRFWSGMPDLNLDSEAVRQEIDEIVRFWLDKGVAGFRLDATTSYYTGDDAKNIAFMEWLTGCVKEKKPDAYLVGECWANNQTYTGYYASGMDSFFNFDFADQGGNINKVLTGGSARAFGENIVAVDSAIAAKNPAYINAAFTSNHDTGRSAGFYAGDNAVAQIKMAQALAMMMGGNYFLYYGDEIGMKGSGDDENKRCPMQWGGAGTGMCDSLATKEIDMIYGSVEEQQADGNSILRFVQEGLALRSAFPEIARGENSVVEALSDEDVLVLQKDYEGSQLLIVMNLSESGRTVDLSQVSLNGKNAGEAEAVGMLITGESAVSYDGGSVTMPAFSIELFQ